MNPNLSESATTGIVVGGVIVPAMWVLWYGVRTSEVELSVYAGIILLSVTFLGIYRTLPWKRELVQSAYQPNSDSEGQHLALDQNENTGNHVA